MVMRKKIILAAVILFCAVSYARFSSAQTVGNDYAFLTWHANNFYPADFAGKPLPALQSTVDVSVTYVSNKKLQDLSQKNITWYLDGDYYQGGVGLSEVSLPINRGFGTSYSLRAAFQTDSGEVSAIAIIPIFKAMTVIDAPFPNLAVPQGTSITLSALPYFFGVSSINNLSFSWAVNGIAQPAESGGTLTLDIGTLGSGQTIAVQSGIANTQSLVQSDRGSVTLTTE